MSQHLQHLSNFKNCQLDNLVDFEKCCKTHIFLQKSVPIQPKTSEILPKFCQKLATTLELTLGDEADVNATPARNRERGPGLEEGAGGLGLRLRLQSISLCAARSRLF